jgi:1-acyl-sn-glycerol-3-phosphate acyltransferase
MIDATANTAIRALLARRIWCRLILGLVFILTKSWLFLEKYMIIVTVLMLNRKTNSAKQQPHDKEVWWLVYVVIASQLLLWSTMKIINLFTISRVKIQLQLSDLAADQPHIIAANHESRIDPFTIVGALPPRIFFKLMPIRFFAYNGLFHTPLRPLLYMAGCFPAYRTDEWLSGLDAAEHYASRLHTVFIFPEGKRTLHRSGKARSGVMVLSKNVNAMIIPSEIRWYHRRWGRRGVIKIGKPFVGHELSPDKIMEIIHGS